jgi:hypothetical protein
VFVRSDRRPYRTLEQSGADRASHEAEDPGIVDESPEAVRVGAVGNRNALNGTV